MTFLAPGFLVATLVAALAAIALHFIAWRRPDDLMLPTARFVPDRSSRRSARAARPSDLPLLLLRLAVLALIGAALARPVLTPRRAGVARIVALDRSRAVADPGAARDSALAFASGADAAEVIVFDSLATVRSRGELSSIGEARPEAKGSLSGALVLLLRRADALYRQHERVEVAIVSSFAEEEFDAATLPLRGLWPDSIRLIRVAAVPPRAASAAVEVRSADDDPVAAGVRLALAHGMLERGTDVRLVRGALTSADSAWVRDGDRVLAHWPDSTGPGTAAGRLRADSAAPAEAVRGVLVGDRAVVGHLRAMTLADTGAVAARWLDGAPAARQQSLGGGCVRTIGFDVPRDGDFTLSPAFRRVAAGLLAPCGGSIAVMPVADTLLSRLAGGTRETASASGSRRAGATASGESNPLRAGLLALAMALAVIELLVRRPRGGGNMRATRSGAGA